jgi:hypothetical protein
MNERMQDLYQISVASIKWYGTSRDPRVNSNEIEVLQGPGKDKKSKFIL